MSYFKGTWRAQEKVLDTLVDQGIFDYDGALSHVGLEKIGVEPIVDRFGDVGYDNWKYGVVHNPDLSPEDRQRNGKGIAAIRKILRGNDV